MDRDPLSLEEIEWALWCTVMCQCENCKVVLDLSEFESFFDQSPSDWAKAAAPFVKLQGWSAPEDFELLCPVCTTRQIDEFT